MERTSAAQAALVAEVPDNRCFCTVMVRIPARRSALFRNVGYRLFVEGKQAKKGWNSSLHCCYISNVSNALLAKTHE
jgi:hypothetical protein